MSVCDDVCALSADAAEPVAVACLAQPHRHVAGIGAGQLHGAVAVGGVAATESHLKHRASVSQEHDRHLDRLAQKITNRPTTRRNGGMLKLENGRDARGKLLSTMHSSSVCICLAPGLIGESCLCGYSGTNSAYKSCILSPTQLAAAGNSILPTVRILFWRRISRRRPCMLIWCCFISAPLQCMQAHLLFIQQHAAFITPDQWPCNVCVFVCVQYYPLDCPISNTLYHVVKHELGQYTFFHNPCGNTARLRIRAA